MSDSLNIKKEDTIPVMRLSAGPAASRTSDSLT